MSDSDMDIDDDEDQVQEKPTISGLSELLHRPIADSDSYNDDKSKIIKDSGNSGNNIVKLEDEKVTTISRFPALGPGTMAKSFPSGNEPEHKRAALLCKFYGRGWCVNGNSCRFLHVIENSNHTSQNFNTNSFTVRSSSVHEHIPPITSYRKTDIESSGPAWTGSVFSSLPMNEYTASTLGHIETRKNMYGSGPLPMPQGVSVSSYQVAEGNTTSNKKKISSDDWEPSKPFQPSFTIPPYILPSSDALYDPFTDIEEYLEDRSLSANNDDKNSSCSQNQHQDTMARKNLEPQGLEEGVATSVVNQNDTTTPSKEVSSAEKRVVSKRSKPAGHDSWHRSDGSSYKKTLKSDEVEGEVRSDTGTKAMKQFRTAVVETIKEMLRPLWREGRLSKDVHNMIVKKAAEKVVSVAVQCHQVPTDTISVEQYLSLSATRIVKLVEGYVEKYGKE